MSLVWRVSAALLVAAAGARAQAPDPLRCEARADGPPAQVRLEGVAELVSDVIVQCTGGVPTPANQAVRSITFQLFTQPSVNITSRRTAASLPGVFSEALLLVDEPRGDQQTLCGSESMPYSRLQGSVIPGSCMAVAGTGDGRRTYDPDAPSPVLQFDGVFYRTARGNAFQSRQIAANSLIWLSIPFDPPGTSGVRTLRFTNVRVNASQIIASQINQADRPIQIFVASSSPGPGPGFGIPIINPTATVAVTRSSLDFSVQNPARCASCAASCETPGLRLRFGELFVDAWRPREAAEEQNEPGRRYHSESGFFRATTARGPEGERWPALAQNGAPMAGPGTETVGRADQGTRLVARFANIPAGAHVWVDVASQLVMTDTRQRTGQANLIEPRPAADATPGQPFEVAVVGGAGQATWEVTATDPEAREEFLVQVLVTYDKAPIQAGAITADGSYGPFSAMALSSDSAPRPRFLTPAGSPLPPLTRIEQCRTNLLFPFVSSRGGVDTDVVLLNTVKAPGRAPRPPGRCLITYYGKGEGGDEARVAVTGKPIQLGDGEHAVVTLSEMGEAAPGFQGYAIAACDFQFAQGVALLRQGEGRSLTGGYLAVPMDGAR